MNSIQQSKARSVADLSEGTILASVEIAAAPERVFRALASKEIVEWWGADGVYRTTEWTGEVRVGGRFRAAGAEHNGKPFAVQGEYLEVDAPRRLVHTWEADWDPGSTTRVTYVLEPLAGGTRLTLRHTGFPSRESCLGHTDGWAMVLDWLAGFVRPGTSTRSLFVMRLIPPRPTFPQDITEAEQRIMGEHVAYWTKLLGEGVAVAFGPVADPKGIWGLALVEVSAFDAVKKLEAEDPAIHSGAGFRYEVLPMLEASVRPN